MRKKLTKNFWNIEVWAVQKHVNLIDLVKSFPTNINLQNLASIQKRTSPVTFAHLAEKSGNHSMVRYRTFQLRWGWLCMGGKRCLRAPSKKLAAGCLRVPPRRRLDVLHPAPPGTLLRNLCREKWSVGRVSRATRACLGLELRFSYPELERILSNSNFSKFCSNVFWLEKF